MDMQVQFQLKEVQRKKAEALKSRGSANMLIIFAIIFLILAFLDFMFVAAAFISTSSGEEVDVVGAMQGMFCCGSLCFIYGIFGVIVLPIGIEKRGNANKKLKAAETEAQEIQKQLIALQ